MTAVTISRREFLAQTALLTASGLLYARPLRALERVGVAVVGLDVGGRGHLDALSLSGDARVVVLCDRRTACLNVAARHPAAGSLARLETDVRRVWDDPQVEGVLLAAGPSTPELLRDACAAGKDVYVAAPVTTDARLARQLAAEAVRKGRVVQQGTAGTSDPVLLDTAARAAAGAAGALQGIYVQAAYTGVAAADGITGLLDELHLAVRLFGDTPPQVRHSLRTLQPPSPGGRASLSAVELEVGESHMLVELLHRPGPAARLTAHVTVVGNTRLEFTSGRSVESGRAVYTTVEHARHVRNFLCCARDRTPDRLAGAPGPAAGAIALRAALTAA